MKKPLINNKTTERAGAIISLCLILWALTVIRSCYAIDLEAREVNKLIAIPKQYGAEELIKKKLVDVDVRSPLDGQSKIINKFLAKIKEKKSAVLKTLVEDEEGLAVGLYVYDNKAPLRVANENGSSIATYYSVDEGISPISITKYYVQLQRSVIIQGQCFSGTYEIQHGIVDVYLKAAKKPSHPELKSSETTNYPKQLSKQLIGDGKFLYSYYKK